MSDFEMICTPCGDEIGPNRKYLVVYGTPNGFQIEVGCEHFRPNLDAPVVAVLGGMACARDWFAAFLQGLQCKHPS